MRPAAAPEEGYIGARDGAAEFSEQMDYPEATEPGEDFYALTEQVAESFALLLSNVSAETLESMSMLNSAISALEARSSAGSLDASSWARIVQACCGEEAKAPQSERRPIASLRCPFAPDESEEEGETETHIEHFELPTLPVRVGGGSARISTRLHTMREDLGVKRLLHGTLRQIEEATATADDDDRVFTGTGSFSLCADKLSAPAVTEGDDSSLPAVARSVVTKLVTALQTAQRRAISAEMRLALHEPASSPLRFAAGLPVVSNVSFQSGIAVGSLPPSSVHFSRYTRDEELRLGRLVRDPSYLPCVIGVESERLLVWGGSLSIPLSSVAHVAPIDEFGTVELRYEVEAKDGFSHVVVKRIAVENFRGFVDAIASQVRKSKRAPMRRAKLPIVLDDEHDLDAFARSVEARAAEDARLARQWKQRIEKLLCTQGKERRLASELKETLGALTATSKDRHEASLAEKRRRAELDSIRSARMRQLEMMVETLTPQYSLDDEEEYTEGDPFVPLVHPWLDELKRRLTKAMKGTNKYQQEAEKLKSVAVAALESKSVLTKEVRAANEAREKLAKTLEERQEALVASKAKREAESTRYEASLAEAKATITHLQDTLRQMSEQQYQQYYYAQQQYYEQQPAAVAAPATPATPVASQPAAASIDQEALAKSVAAGVKETLQAQFARQQEALKRQLDTLAGLMRDTKAAVEGLPSKISPSPPTPSRGSRTHIPRVDPQATPRSPTRSPAGSRSPSFVSPGSPKGTAPPKKPLTPTSKKPVLPVRVATRRAAPVRPPPPPSRPGVKPTRPPRRPGSLRSRRVQ